MNKTNVKFCDLKDFPLWPRMRSKRKIFQFGLELTARCNNDCRHCYINRPIDDIEAEKREPTLEEIMKIADQAIEMGALWCTITGGEPLLRRDFPQIYLGLKKKGVMISVYTNACLIREEHVALFKKYPPQDLEVTVYGVTKKTYEAVTRRPGSFTSFVRGLGLLLDNGVKVRLKAMALRSNVLELPLIAEFCRRRTKDYFRFDPFLHLRIDKNPARNTEIREERLSPQEIVALEKADSERFSSLEQTCSRLIRPERCQSECNHLFYCATGLGGFILGHEGNFRLCLSLSHPECVYDLRQGSLEDAWQNFVPQVRNMQSSKKGFIEGCRSCPLIDLCIWCPANAYLETGEMDRWVEYFCLVANARAEALSVGGYAKETL